MKRLHREDIKSVIRKEFGSMAEFERAKKLPTGSARDVLRGKSVSRTADSIAEVLGFEFKVIGLDKKRSRTSAHGHNMSAKRDLHRLNEGGK